MTKIDFILLLLRLQKYAISYVVPLFTKGDNKTRAIIWDWLMLLIVPGCSGCQPQSLVVIFRWFQPVNSLCLFFGVTQSCRGIDLDWFTTIFYRCQYWLKEDLEQVTDVNYSILMKVPRAHIVTKRVITEQVNVKMKKGDFNCWVCHLMHMHFTLKHWTIVQLTYSWTATDLLLLNEMKASSVLRYLLDDRYL